MKKVSRLKVALVCEICGNRNYRISKSSSGSSKKPLELKKFCPSCNQHTLHQESK